MSRTKEFLVDFGIMLILVAAVIVGGLSIIGDFRRAAEPVSTAPFPGIRERFPEKHPLPDDLDHACVMYESPEAEAMARRTYGDDYVDRMLPPGLTPGTTPEEDTSTSPVGPPRPRPTP